MSEDPTPSWAIPLVKLVERIDQKLDGHRDTLLDHEDRIRATEAITASIAATLDRISRIEENESEIFERLRALEKKLWIAVGALSLIGFVAGLVAFNINIGG
jgi:predicted Co/Zn/Cd cation transporter (cation efflux family)